MSTKRIGVLLLLLPLFPGIAAAYEGNWLVAPYIWMSDVGWDVASRGNGTVAFSDVVNKLDGAGLVRVEYARNKIGFTFDYIGMSLSDRRRFSTPGPLPLDVTVNAKLDLTVFETGVVYRPTASETGLQIIGGVRSTDVNSQLVVTPAGTPPQRFDTGDSFADIFVGARYLQRINESWDWSVRGDYGLGGSDGAVNIIAGVGWRSPGAFGVHLAYRHLAFDFDQRIDGEPARSEFDFTGPAVGFMFRF